MSYAFPPVVLVHGWGGSFDGTWRRTGWADALAAAGRQVIEIDVPGHGQAGGSHDPADYGDLASAIDAKLPAGALDAVGFSLGGKLVLELASRAPERFRRIVIGGLGDNIFARELGDRLANALEAGFTEEHRALMPVIARYVDESPSDYLSIAAVLRRPPNPSAEEGRLKAIQSDILIVNGTEDAVADPNGRLRECLPRAGYHPLPGVDHFSLHAQPAFQEAALNFLNGA